jgi:hypothetical protein
MQGRFDGRKTENKTGEIAYTQESRKVVADRRKERLNKAKSRNMKRRCTLMPNQAIISL